MTLKDLQGTIESIGSRLAPDDDWMPTLLLEKDGNSAIIGIPPTEDESQKPLFAALLYATIKNTNPDRAFLVTTAWVGSSLARDQFMSEEHFMEAISEGWIPSPSEDPDRQEAVNVVMCDKNDESGMMIGYIERSEHDPPKIVKWEIIEGSKSEIKGRLGDAMRKGFADADKKGNLDVLNELPGVMRG